jgi:hypothetical protein
MIELLDLFLEFRNPILAINGRPIKNNVVVERSDSFATYIRFRYNYNQICFKCKLAFGGREDAKNHKREVHSY